MKITILMDSIQNKIQGKLPQLEAMFANASSGYKIVRTPQGLSITKAGLSVELTEEQIKGVEMYLNLSTIFTADDFQEETTKERSSITT